MDTALVALGVVVSAVVGVFATVLFEDRFADLLVRIGGRASNSSRRRIDGAWYSVYWHRGVDGSIKSVRTLIRFRQLRGRVIGQSTGSHSKFRVSGALDRETYLTAIWHNDADGSLYTGSCQLIVEPEGDALAGRWVGWNKKHQVGSGGWIIVRLEAACSTREFANLLAKFEENPATVQADYPTLASRLESIVLRQIPGADIPWRDARKELARPPQGA